ncbi:GAF domain-containing sensor histidine kinase [Aquimarina agarivorans]|uniref:GAF domain-containing sensor histidine kinase n=1 Tax=Aquimarina agarivorans TaxID=980584 RepID=UPI000248E6A5|nr:GAF domain-containing sensor histidine kinase [Aquimarina agarivorans]
MITPDFPNNERLRQKAVESYQLLDTNLEEKYDNITNILSQICNTPIALITLLDNDRNFFKSHHGISFNESPRNISFCGHAINQNEPVMIVQDARKDERFYDNPLVTDLNAIFYAGAPLINSKGYKLGTLCVYDHKPRVLTKEQINAIKIISKQVITLFEQRIQNNKLTLLKESLQRKNKNLEKFAAIVSHDLKSPVNNIISLTELLKIENPDLSKDSLMSMNYLEKSSKSIKNYIDGVLSYYKSDELLELKKEHFLMEHLIEECKNLTDVNQEAQINLEDNVNEIYSNKYALEQIFTNLITNAIKYNDKKNIVIAISCNQDPDYYYFKVSDNGIGIPEESISKIFCLFERLGIEDRYGNQGNGIGLATTHNIITSLGGDITVSSKINEGSIFSFYIEKE